MALNSSEFKNSCGSVLKVLRKKKRLTQLQVARRLNVSKSYISQVENNYIGPSFTRLSQFLCVYGITPKYFEYLVNKKD